MSGGAQKQQGQTTTTPNPIAMAGFTNVMGGAQKIADQNQTWNPAMGVNVAGFSDMQNRAFQGIGSQYGEYADYFDQALGLARQAGQGVTGEDIQRFQNPYTQQVIDTTMANTQRQQAAGLQNVVGNEIAQNAQGGDRAMLQKALTEGEFARQNNATTAGLESQGYSQALAAAQAQKGQELQASYGLANQATGAQNYNLQGLMALLGAGGQQQGLQQSQMNAATQNATSQTMWPMQLQQWLAGITGSMGSLMGGTSATDQKTSDKPGFANYLGMGAGLAGSLSDERAKENKRVVGELYDGQKVYAFNYKGHPETQLGLMAQEVEHHHPESVGETDGGLKTVRYDVATKDAAKRGHFAAGGTPNPFDSGSGGSTPWGSLGSNPWGNLISNAPPSHGNLPQANMQPGKPKSGADSQKEMSQSSKGGKDAGKNIKEMWDQWNKSQGNSASAGKNPWDTQVVPSDSPAATGTGETLVSEPEVTVTEGASGLGDLGGGLTMGPGAGATAADLGAGAAGAAGGAGAGATEGAGAAGAGLAAGAADLGAGAAAGTGAAAAGAGEGAGAGLTALLALLAADGGKIDTSRALHEHARKMLHLAGGGAADGAAEGDEPYINQGDFVFDEPETPVDTPDVQGGMWRTPHEPRTHFDPYMGKFPKMEPTVPHEKVGMMTRAPEIPGPGEPQSRLLPEHEPKIPEEALSNRPITAPVEQALAEAKFRRNEGLVQPSETMARGRHPESAGWTSGLRLPTRADVAELMKSTAAAPQALDDYFSAETPKPRDLEAEKAAQIARKNAISDLNDASDVGRGEIYKQPAAVSSAEGVTPPLPERKSEALAPESFKQSEWDALGGIDKFRAIYGRNPTAEETATIIKQSEQTAAGEWGAGTPVSPEDEKRAKIKRYWDAATGFADKNLSMNAAPPATAEAQAHADRAMLKDALKRVFPSWMGEHPAEAAAPAIKEKGPEQFIKSEYGLEPVAPTMVKSTPAEHTGFTARQANRIYQGIEPTTGRSDVPPGLAAHEAEPYAAGVAAPKAGSHAEETPSRYETGARTAMTKRLKFENDLGGVTRDTSGNPSMGNYGILATPGGGSSADDFYHDHGAELGFTHSPRQDPWGFAEDWKRIAKENPAGLEKAEENWHDKYIKGSVRAHMLNAGLPGSVSDDPRVQEYFQDRYVQHGTGISKNPEGRNGANRIKRSWDKAEGDIPTFLKNMSAEDKAHVRHDFETYLSEHPSHQPGLEKRITNRLNGALGEKVQPGGASEQVSKQAEGEKEATEAAPKTAADLLPHEKNQVNFIQKILGGWNPLEGITGPGKEGPDSWNPLGLTSQQRQNLTMMGLAMMGGDPRGMRAFGAGAQGLQQAQQMQMNEQSMGVQRAKLALEAMNQPKFTPVHWTDMMGMQHAGMGDVHTGQMFEGGTGAPVSKVNIAPGSVQAAPGAAGAAGAGSTGEPAVDQMFQQYPGMRNTVEGVLDGSMNLSQIPMRQRAGIEEAAQAVARSRGETWSPVINDQRNKFRGQFLNGDSKTGIQIEAINRASDHINTLTSLHDQLGDPSTIGGKVAGAYHDILSKDPVRDRFKFMGKALSSELAKLESGGKGAQRTQEEWEAMFDPSAPRAVRAGAIMQAFDLMKGNMHSLDQKWINGMQGSKTSKIPDYMSPDVRNNMHAAQMRYEQASGKTPEGTKSEVSKPPAPIPVIREQLKEALKIADSPVKRQAILDRAKGWGIYGLEAQP